MGFLVEGGTCFVDGGGDELLSICPATLSTAQPGSGREIESDRKIQEKTRIEIWHYHVPTHLQPSRIGPLLPSRIVYHSVAQNQSGALPVTLIHLVRLPTVLWILTSIRSTMTAPRVLRIARSEDTDAFVLIHVVHTGPAFLDLTLTATEGECPYTALGRSSLKRSRECQLMRLTSKDV